MTVIYHEKHIDEHPSKLNFVCPEYEKDPAGLIMFSFFAMITIIGLVFIISIFKHENLKMCVENASNKNICFTK